MFLKFLPHPRLTFKELIGIGRCENGIYQLEGTNKIIAIMAVKVDSDIWHRRLRLASIVTTTR